jgi:hypothetical protein
MMATMTAIINRIQAGAIAATRVMPATRVIVAVRVTPGTRMTPTNQDRGAATTDLASPMIKAVPEVRGKAEGAVAVQARATPAARAMTAEDRGAAVGAATTDLASPMIKAVPGAKAMPGARDAARAVVVAAVLTKTLAVRATGQGKTRKGVVIIAEATKVSPATRGRLKASLK